MGIMDVLEKLADRPEIPEALPEELADQVPEAPEDPEERSPEATESEEVPEAVSEAVTQTPLEEPDEDLPALEEVMAAVKKRHRLRPEWILAVLAVLSAVLLGVVLVLCLPAITESAKRSEDPEALPGYHAEAVTLPTRAVMPEPSLSETEPENPTIPPEKNPYDRYDFQYDRHNYLRLQNVRSYAGVDVSAYQGEIDWKKVKQSGIEFAMIRLGYRGYESGKLVEDKYARDNLEQAKAAGLKVGAYFFSQALSIQETDQEIAYMLQILGENELDMPIVLDWEIPASDARTANMDARTLTDIQRHFCGQMRKRGYTPMVYFNWHQSEKLYYLSELEEYPFWLALYQDRMTYPWRVEMWQWTDSAKVPGIDGNVDLNVYMPH